MNEYGFIIDSMIWSFTRLNGFYNCKQEWKYTYLDVLPKSENGMAQFGTLCHKTLELYEKGKLDIFSVADYYKENFDLVVTERFPYNQYKDLRESYYQIGLDYFENLDLITEEYEILGIEKKVKFTIGDIPVMGYIDLLLRNINTGEITILDHKSASIKLLKSGKVSKKDEEHFESFKKQLYLYSIPVVEEYGHVDYLEWNMFKQGGERITIPWKKGECEAAGAWVLDTIKQIKEEEEWPPKLDPFYCRYLCCQRNNCEDRHALFKNDSVGEEETEI